MMLETDLQPHIKVGRNQSADYALLPGDPGRVERIAAFLDDVEELAYNASSAAFVVNTKGVSVGCFYRHWRPLYGIAVEELKQDRRKNDDTHWELVPFRTI